MADFNFFGFGTKLVSKGAEDVFADGPPDDDIDLLNDETFGDCDPGDWEESHNRIAEVLENDSFYNDERSSFHYKKSSSSDEEDKEELEQQLSHLVSDEDDDSELAEPKGRPIPGRGAQDLDELFGPASPPGLLDTEQLVSPSSKNIWRPPGESPSNGLLALIQGQKATEMSSSFEDPAIVSAVKAKSLSNAPTLADIERPYVTPSKPSVITVEELERGLHGNRNRPSPFMGIPPPTVVPKISGSTPYNTPQAPRILQRTPQNSNMGFDGRQSPMTQGRITPPNLPSHIRMSPPVELAGSPGNFRRTPSPPIHQHNAPILVPLSVAEKIYPHLLGTPFAKPMAGAVAIDPRVVNRTRSPPNVRNDGWPAPSTGYPFLANTPIGPRMPPRMPNTDPTHIRPRQQFYRDQRTRTPYNGNRGGYRGHYTPGPRGNNIRYHLNYNRFDEDVPKMPVDEYANIMTQREKDWIIKIQLLQLQTDNPYLDDYYYTTFTLKKMAMERQKKKDQGIMEEDDSKEPKLLLPQVAKIERVYTPAQFEGVLGKLTTSSVHNPRTIIDAKVTSHQSDEKDKPKDNRKLMQLLLNIERIYDMLLDIDDLEKKVLTLPEDQRQPFYAERKFKIRKMAELLTCDSSNPELFLQCMCVCKGKKLIHRLLPLCDKEQSARLLCVLLKNLPFIIRKDAQDEVLPTIYGSTSQVIHNSTMSDLVQFAEEIQKANVTAMQQNSILTLLQNKYGVTVIFELLNKAESIYSYDPIEIDSKSQNLWSVFVTKVCENLSTLSETSICHPLKKFNGLERHLDRLIENKLLVSIEDKLKAITLH
ncbi:protein PAT1 homolog 1-like [Tubulanus polymorphus]|uniref:protein PAT1 homolog 1-like n=1 Tax=Tubulanus polymorphus TaxID=672921 RepID=UPI003DA2823A